MANNFLEPEPAEHGNEWQEHELHQKRQAETGLEDTQREIAAHHQPDNVTQHADAAPRVVDKDELTERDCAGAKETRALVFRQERVERQARPAHLIEAACEHHGGQEPAKAVQAARDQRPRRDGGGVDARFEAGGATQWTVIMAVEEPFCDAAQMERVRAGESRIVARLLHQRVLAYRAALLVHQKNRMDLTWRLQRLLRRLDFQDSPINPYKRDSHSPLFLLPVLVWLSLMIMYHTTRGIFIESVNLSGRYYPPSIQKPVENILALFRFLALVIFMCGVVRIEWRSFATNDEIDRLLRVHCNAGSLPKW